MTHPADLARSGSPPTRRAALRCRSTPTRGFAVTDPRRLPELVADALYKSPRWRERLRQAALDARVFADQSEIAVIGRFGYSFTAPPPEWVATKNWKQVAAWQTVVDTAPITIAIQ